SDQLEPLRTKTKALSRSGDPTIAASPSSASATPNSAGGGATLDVSFCCSAQLEPLRTKTYAALAPAAGSRSCVAPTIAVSPESAPDRRTEPGPPASRGRRFPCGPHVEPVPTNPSAAPPPAPTPPSPGSPTGALSLESATESGPTPDAACASTGAGSDQLEP